MREGEKKEQNVKILVQNDLPSIFFNCTHDVTVGFVCPLAKTLSWHGHCTLTHLTGFATYFR